MLRLIDIIDNCDNCIPDKQMADDAMWSEYQNNQMNKTS